MVKGPFARAEWYTLTRRACPCFSETFPSPLLQRCHPGEDEEKLLVKSKLQLRNCEQSILGLWSYGEVGDCTGKSGGEFQACKALETLWRIDDVAELAFFPFLCHLAADW